MENLFFLFLSVFLGLHVFGATVSSYCHRTLFVLQFSPPTIILVGTDNRDFKVALLVVVSGLYLRV